MRGDSTRRQTAFALIVLLSSLLFCAGKARDQESRQRTINIGVFSLFKPRELIVRPVAGAALRVRAAGGTFVLRDSASARLRAVHGAIEIEAGGQVLAASEVRAEAVDAAGGFVLSVPGKIERRFVGELCVRSGPDSAAALSNSGTSLSDLGAPLFAGRAAPMTGTRHRFAARPAKGGRASPPAALVAVVTMGLETAVASAVAAESLPGTPIEALKAQAIATRSFYRANPRGRHAGFAFCDTTHCQFLRTPPDASDAAFAATAATRGLVLTFEGEPIEALFSARCGGKTHSLSELGMTPRHYPYYAVECAWCARHPAPWQRKVDAAAAAELARRRSEAARIELTRALGWHSVPGNDYEIVKSGDEWLLKGRGEGHGVGLCQRGAAGMAETGATFPQILAHYYPNSMVRFLEE